MTPPKTQSEGRVMKRWEGNAILTSGQYLGTVEAETKEEAQALFWGRAGVSLCHHCSGEMGDVLVDDVEVFGLDETGEPKP